jgi:nitroimidazol reductase NimA-like FMN-containing flavoprotein (pyridoxamine 5'-phosphate oxidase superfamily)
MIEHDLTPVEIDTLLRKQCYAHLGFTNAEGDISVLPISYVYRDGIFFSFSTRGSKIEAMHKNPRVCIQVEELHHATAWKSVQAWGRFSEVGSKDVGQFKLLVEDFWKRFDKNELIFSVFRDFMDNPSVPMTLYHVTVDKMIGKQGKHSRSPEL